MSAEKKLRVRQIKSKNGKDKRVLATLQSLGLGKIGTEREYVVNPAVIGMLKKVSHLVEIQEV